MVLGLTPEAYVVYFSHYGYGYPAIASINGNLLFFTAYNSAKNAAEEFIQLHIDNSWEMPIYIWIQPINKLWTNGED